MFDISFGEFLLILAIAMVFLGPERIPQVARMLGRGVRRLRNAFAQMREEMTADEQTAKAFTEMQGTMQEIAQVVNVRRVVRELSEPLLTSPFVQDPVSSETNNHMREDAPDSQSVVSNEPAISSDIEMDVNVRRIEKIFHPASEHEATSPPQDSR